MTEGMTKKELRRLIRECKNTVPAEVRKQQSVGICSAILSHPAVRQADTVIAFWPLPDEPDIRHAVRQLHAQGKTILLPRMVSDSKMILCLYDGDASLTASNPYSILEPQGPEVDVCTITGSMAMLVPGMAFAKSATGRGYDRLGRGKGYYDRFLAAASEHSITTIGICYDFQVLDHIPTEPFDYTIQELISHTYLWKTSK